MGVSLLQDSWGQDGFSAGTAIQSPAAGKLAPGSSPKAPMTIAERSNFLATSRGADVTDFLATLDASSPYAQLVQYGATNEQRPLWSLVVAREENIQLPLPPDDPRLVIVLLGGIHSGECDSKEALLALARDVLQQEKPPFLDQAVLVFAPNFNADGNERVGQLHRPGQEGPALGMGTRENAIGQDLNRDFVKLDSPEVRSLVRMLDAWDVDVLIDAHTTNGSLHRYDMTYDLPHNPAADPQIIDWMRQEFFPVVSDRMTAQGAPIFYYGNFNREHTVWESYGFEPRYSTEYMGLRGKIGILVESYSYASYQRRIEVSYAFIETCLQQLTQQSARIQSLLNNPRNEPPRAVAIQGKIVADETPAKVAAYAWPPRKSETTEKEKQGNAPIDRDHSPSDEKGAAVTARVSDTNFPSPKDRGSTKDMVETEYTVTIANRGQATLQVDAPEYYFIPEDYAWAASRIRLHGIPMIRVFGSASAPAEQYVITTRKEANEFQFRRMARYAIDTKTIDAKLGPGWLVPTNHALGVLATYLLEPHSDESLAMWGFFDPELKESSSYPVLRLASKPNFEKSIPLPKLDWLEFVPKDMEGESLTLEKLYDPQLKVGYSGMPTPLPRWTPTGESYLTQRDNRWYQVDCATGSMQPWDRLGKMVEALSKLPGFEEGAAAPYGKQIGLLDETLSAALIRHKNDLYFYDGDTQQATQLTETPDDEEELYALSPNRSHVAFVRDQNLWVVDCKTRELRQLTTDGGGEILNGKLDWVYQEEIYGRGQFKSHWWNSDGTKLAYLRLNETPVPNFVVDNSLSYEQKIENIRYPKAGQDNPLVELHVVDIRSGEDVTVPIDRFEPQDQLVVRVGWKPNQPQQLVYQLQNRIQNQLDVVQYDLETNASQTLVHEESPAWIDVIDVPRWLPDGSFLWLSDSDGGRRHIQWISPSGERRSLTQGDWDVKEIAAIADSGKSVWFTGHRSAPTNTDVLRLSLETGEIEIMASQWGSHRISVHPTGSYFFDSWSDLQNPAQLWLKGRDGQGIRYLSGYRSDRFDYLKKTDIELFEIPARDGQPMQAMLYRPQRASTASTKAPVLIHVYGGPSAPTVENSWTHRSDLWHRYLAQQGIAVLLCDNRSALGSGNADTWKIYRNLGEVEMRDLEDAARWLGSQDWADPERIGLWGWSYGGYFTAYALTHSKLFYAGISGAPVTDWRNYDSVYTERYMDTPQSNPSGYESSSVVTAAKNLYGKLLLIHGEIDDNVHMANSMQFAHALQKAGKPFELMVYPNNRHGITDPQQSFHQYQLMTDFIFRTLGERLKKTER
ncbi:MAG: DPP IV N-terminal domain-containing protein [Planctomycetota bacterium]